MTVSDVLKKIKSLIGKGSIDEAMKIILIEEPELMLHLNEKIFTEAPYKEITERYINEVKEITNKLK